MGTWASTPVPAPSLSPTSMMTASPVSAMGIVWRGEVRRVLRAPGAQAVGRRRRAAGLLRSARAGRAPRLDRHPLVLARGAPLPRGVQPLVCARDLPGRAVAADEAS